MTNTTTYPGTALQRLLAKYNAPKRMRSWVGYRTEPAAIAECQRGDWLIWYCARRGLLTRAQVADLARSFAERAAAAAGRAAAGAAPANAAFFASRVWGACDADAAAWAACRAAAWAVYDCRAADSDAEYARQCDEIRAALAQRTP